jgi:OOP family OmpA-OmpF porin
LQARGFITTHLQMSLDSQSSTQYYEQRGLLVLLHTSHFAIKHFKEQIMKKTAIAALISFSALVAAPAGAAVYYDTSYGFYGGVKVGGVNYDFNNVTNNSQAGYGLLLGYNFSPNFGVELEYNSLGGFDIPDPASASSIKGRALGISAVGMIPLNRQFSLYGKMGIATTTLRDSPGPGYTGTNYTTYTYNDTNLTFGFGGLFNVTPVVGFRVGYDFYEVKDQLVSYRTHTAGMLGITGLFKF